MKKITFWKSLFLLFALIVGSMNVWADSNSYTANSNDKPSATNGTISNSVTGTNSISWSYSVTQSTKSGKNPHVSYAEASGWQLGSSNSPCTAFSISTSGITGTITKIEVESGSASASSKISVTVGGVAFGTQNQSTGSGSTVAKQTFTGSASGAIIVSASASSGAFYFKSVTVTYSTKTLSSIAVTTAPTTIAFKQGETLDLTGIVVTATYSDASTENVTDKCTFSPTNGATLSTSGNQNVTATYSGKETNQAITVAGVTALAVKTAPTKTAYKYGQTLDLTGLVLTATYSDSGTKDIDNGFTAEPAGGSELTASGNVTFTYYGQSCNQAYTVGTLSSLTYNSTGEGAFANTTYTEKDKFDPTGLVVTAHYSNGIEEVITDYTLTPNTTTELKTTDENVTVSYTWAETEQTVNIPITVNAGTKYKVSFDAGNGTYTGSDITETEYQGGITLPAATTSVSGWEFAGWKETSATANTTTRPTLFAAGSTYKPTANCTLYAVYKLAGIDDTKYKRVTELSEATSASTMIFVDKKNNKVFKLNGNNVTYATAPTEDENGMITPSDDIVWSLTGNNTDGYNVKTTSLETNRYVGFDTPSANTNYANIQTYTTTSNNILWKFVKNTDTDNVFTLRNNTEKTNGYVGSLRFYTASNTNKWQVYYLAAASYAENENVALKLYIPVPCAYNSNPSAIITPTVEFGKEGTTLYLDADDKTYTNTATVEGVSKTVIYKSSDEKVATVTSAGVVTAVGIGTATINAKVDKELGVSNEASDTYDVTVKSTTTIAGIKAVNTTSTAKDFTADLTDANITYVSGTHAYIQDASAAIYVSCATNDWVAGKKFNGAVSGKVKKSYGVWEITELTGTPVEGGSVPAALTDVAIADITAATYASYEGKKITLTGVTVTTAMASTATSGGEVSDGTNTIKIAAPATGITLVKDEQGSVTGFVAQYSGTYRLNLYEQSPFVKTHNAPKTQTLTFTSDAIELDEDTEDFTNFTPQAVSGAQGTVTYAIEGDEIYKDFNTTDGTFTLKTGVYGTATITATAAAANIEEASVITPYTETSKSYTITVYPRYSSTFNVNGVVAEVRQATHGAAISVPEPTDVGDYYFMGWKEGSAIDTPTDEAPAMVTPPTTPTSNVTYYAVYAQERTGGEEEVISSLSLNQTEPTGATSDVNGVTWSWQSVSFGSSGSSGMKGNNNATVTFELPTTAIKAKSISLTCPNQDWGSGAVVVLKAGNSELASLSKGGSYTFTNSDNTAGTYTLSQTTSKNAWINAFALTYTVLGKENYDYRTSLPVVDVTVTATGYLSYCSPYKLDFSETNVKAYKASVNETTGEVTLTKLDVVPAEEGVVLFSSEAKEANEATTYTIPVTDKAPSDVTGNQMKGVLERTQVVWNPSTGVYNYILQQGEFRKATTPGGYLKANRAYLSTSYNVTTPGAKALTIVFNDNTTGINGVEEIAPVTKTRKVVKNGRIVIETANGEFTIDGAKMK
jgi:hypothetical protein